MTVEVSPQYPSDLNASYPAAGDNIPEGDDHLRNIKTVLKTTFPNINAAVTATPNQLNGVSSAFTGTPTAPTAAAGTATTQIATTAFVASTAFTTATGLTAASQAEMEAGTEAGLRAMSPLRVGQAVAALATGGITTIASGSLPAAATLDITNIPATYAYLVLEITAASQDTNSCYTQVQVSINNGSSFDTTAANYMGISLVATDPVLTTAASMLQPGSATAIGNSITSTVVMAGYQAGPRMKYSSQSNLSNAPTFFNEVVGTYIGSTSAINALRILTSAAGSFDGGTYALYGLS